MRTRTCAAAWMLSVIGTLYTPALFGQQVSRQQCLALARCSTSRSVRQFVNYIGGWERPGHPPSAHVANKDCDFVVYDLEHVPFDVPHLTEYMQSLLDRRAIVGGGYLPDAVRIRADALQGPRRARVAHQDRFASGEFIGFVFPHTETVEEVLHAMWRVCDTRRRREVPTSSSMPFEARALQSLSRTGACRPGNIVS